jgi:hypothetical protein
MRRSFKLATVFTGAAALAGGYGPTALAATTQATEVHPDIGPARECLANNGGVSNWVHLYYPNDDHPAMCIGGVVPRPPVPPSPHSVRATTTAASSEVSTDAPRHSALVLARGGTRSLGLSIPPSPGTSTSPQSKYSARVVTPNA